MCGRYAITLPPEAVRAFFDFVEQPNFPPRYNIAPTQPIPIVYAREFTGGRERHFRLVRWGFLPGFVKDPKEFPLIINARAETIAQKPSFRNALKRRRCLVVADGFYEWRKTSEKGPKQPFLIRRLDREPIGFAGLYETYIDASGSELDTACIVTTAANKLMSPVHDRMPVILPHDLFSHWLDCDNVSTPEAVEMLMPAAEDVLELIPIATGVNSVANDDASLQEPKGPPLRAQAQDLKTNGAGS
jgi:putative SOS response-associated peptidase YedK